jgi:hypothetical protein
MRIFTGKTAPLAESASTSSPTHFSTQVSEGLILCIEGRSYAQKEQKINLPQDRLEAP